jgi:tetratricopeptide (TPR) repeat protein
MSVAESPPHRETTPYPGTRPFTETDHWRFFGRADVAREVARLWRQHQVTVLYGENGVGKTSLLRAGVVPAIASAPATVLPVGRVSRVSTFPMAALPEQNPYTLALLSSWSPGDRPAHLSAMRIDAVLRRHERTDRHGAPLPILIAIDQAERLFRDADAGLRHRFFEELLDALGSRPHAHLLLAVRADRLTDSLKALGGGHAAEFMLPSLDRQRALEAVSGPIEQAGRSLAPGVAAKIVDELSPPDEADHGEPPDAVEPVLLQVMCRALWDELPDGVRTITGRMVPDTAETLREFCAQVLATVAADHGRRPKELLAWLHTAFLSRRGTKAVREKRARTGGITRSLLHAMEDQHLIRTRLRDGSRWHELQRSQLAMPLRWLEDAHWPVHPPDAAGYLHAAKMALAQGDTHLARQQAEEALNACDPGNLRIRADAESVLGNAAHEERDRDGAIQHYRRAADLFEALQDSTAVGRLLAGIGQLQLANGQRAEAVGKLEAAAGRIPNDPTVQMGLGQALWDAGRPKAALAVLDGVLRSQGNTPEALRARGEILADLGDAESALRDLNRIDLDRIDRRSRPSAQAARALALATLSRTEAAQLELDDTGIDATDSGPVLLRAAQVQRLSGRPDVAAELASRALLAKSPPLPPHQRVDATRISKRV